MSPLLSIGMPVYNGENYIAEALDSFLAQTFGDFELIISDNTSTDRTEQICRDYADKDSRISYSRNSENIGAVKNYNRLFKLAKGKYFKWAAHDDMCKPKYLEQCVKVLEDQPVAVLCYPRTIIIDEIANQTIEYNDDLQLISDRPSQRYKRYHQRVRYGHECHPIFGLIRSDILRKTNLFGSYVSCDRILLGELSLHGKFYEVPEFLFCKRHHPNTSNTGYKNFKTRSAWMDPANKGKLQMTRWKMLCGYLAGLRRVEMATYEKFICYLLLGRWCLWYTKWLLKDILKAAAWPFIPPSMKI